MTSSEIQKGIDNATVTLQSACKPWVGTSLRRARISKALTDLRLIEGKCRSQKDIGHCRAALHSAQCTSMADLCNNEVVKQDIPQIVYQMEETLSTWSWLFDNPQYQYPDSGIQMRDTVSKLLAVQPSTLYRRNILYAAQNKVARLSQSCKDPFVTAFRLEVTHTILEECFHQAIRLFEEGRWAPAMSLLKSKDAELDILVELEEKLKEKGVGYDDYSSWGIESRNFYEDGRAGMMRRDFDMQMAMCKCSQLIHTGDLHFKEAMKGDPDDMMARALLAQDDYRAGLGCVTGQDVELEGSVLTRLARFHAKITKMPASAHTLYLRAVHLAAALQPAFPKGSWYQESTDAVQAYRNSLEAEEAQAWNKLREPILEKLSTDIEKLRGAECMSDFEFSKFIYKTWPPKTEGSTEPPSDPEGGNTLSKKHLLKVIQRYHGDKNMAWGDEWRVLSEEIAKSLTARYNKMKGV